MFPCTSVDSYSLAVNHLGARKRLRVFQLRIELLEPNDDGVLVLPLSSSPEVFNNSQRAWLKPNSNYDLMCLRMLFLSLVEMADAMDRSEEAARWQSLADRLGPYHVRKDGTLKLSADADLPGSHRHLSNLMALHPFNL